MNGAITRSLILVPDVGGLVIGASGLLLAPGASVGWGGGVANSRSSCRAYVPSPTTKSSPVGFDKMLLVSRMIGVPVAPFVGREGGSTALYSG